MFDPRNKLTHEVVKEMKQHFPNELLEAVIPRNVKLSEAPSFGKPVLLYDFESKGASAYLALAAEVLKRNGLDAPSWEALSPETEPEASAPQGVEIMEPAIESEAPNLAALEGSDWKTEFAIEKISEIPQETLQIDGGIE